MSTATIYMTDGHEYEVDYIDRDENYTTARFWSDDGTLDVFSKFNMICMFIKEDETE